MGRPQNLMLGKYWGLLGKVNPNQKLKEIKIKMYKIMTIKFEFNSSCKQSFNISNGI
jgi:hypothetical protein